jgi:hypothetical protein
MVIALAQELKAQGINYQQCLHVTAIDVDLLAVYMAYIHCTLLHIPAIILHGETLRATTYSVWRTFAHVMGFWDGKLARDSRRLPPPAPQLPQELLSQPTAPLPPVGTQLSLF